MGLFSRTKKRDSYPDDSPASSLNDSHGHGPTSPLTPPETPTSTFTWTNDYLEPYAGRSSVKNDQNAAINRVLELYRLTQDSTPSFDFSFDFTQLGVPHAEIRALRYLVRMWDPWERSVRRDDDFDCAVAAWGRGDDGDDDGDGVDDFDEMVLRHFYRRVADWYELEQDAKAKKRRAKSGVRDELMEMTSLGAVAQLLWDIKHEHRLPARLLEKYDEEMRGRYRITVVDDGEGEGEGEGEERGKALKLRTPSSGSSW